MDKYTSIVITQLNRSYYSHQAHIDATAGFNTFRDFSVALIWLSPTSMQLTGQSASDKDRNTTLRCSRTIENISGSSQAGTFIHILMDHKFCKSLRCRLRHTGLLSAIHIVYIKPTELWFHWLPSLGPFRYTFPVQPASNLHSSRTITAQNVLTWRLQPSCISP